MSRLRFEIAGTSVSLPAYATAMHRVVQILRELDAAITGGGGTSLGWYIQDLSKNGSLGIEIKSKVKPQAKSKKSPRKDISTSVAESFVTTFENIQKRGISPPYLSEYGLKKLQSMMELLHTNGAIGYRATAVDTTRFVDVDESAEKTLRQLLPPSREEIGSVEGRLETISVHGAKKFIIYHAITRKAVTCIISNDADLDVAKGALGRKVLVSGLVTVNVKNEPIRVNVGTLRVLGSDKHLPSAKSLTGSDPGFTGELTTDEYIRSIRRGN
jgi:hypothetical protein